MEQKILKEVEKYLHKEEKNNGTCRSIKISVLENAENPNEEIKNFVSNSYYRYNSAIIHTDGYGVKWLVLFSV